MSAAQDVLTIITFVITATREGSHLFSQVREALSKQGATITRWIWEVTPNQSRWERSRSARRPPHGTCAHLDHS